MNRWVSAFAVFLLTTLAGYLGMRAFIGSKASTDFAVTGQFSPRRLPAPPIGITAEPGSREEWLQNATRKTMSEKDLVKRLIGIAGLANLQPVDGSGRLQPGMAELLGFDAQQSEQVDKIFHQARARMSDDLKTRLKVNDEPIPSTPPSVGPSGPRNVERQLSYAIAPSQDGGQALKDALHEELSNAVGNTAADVLMGASGLEVAMGSYGKYEISGSIQQGTQGSGPFQLTDVKMVDGQNKKILEGSSSENGIRKIVGSALDEYLGKDSDW